MVSFLSERDIKDLQDYLGLGAGGTARRTTTVNRSRLATVEAEIPLLTSMIQELDSAIAGHTDIHNSSTIVFETRSRILTRAKRKVLELDGHAVSPQSGNPHRYTLIYLHGLGGCGADYLHADSELCWPWRLGPSYAPGLRAVFPSAPLQQQPWGETLPSWYQYQGIASNELAMPEQLAAVQEALDEVIRQEIERLEAPGCVFLGGVSQGCNVALDAYLRHDLGGFAGSVGFLPGDSWGFEGADRRLRTLLQKEQQAARPVWLQAAEEDTEVPYKLVQQSLERAHHWPGFTLRTLQGLGHDIGQHEATLLNDFLKAHAQDAYFEVDMNDAFDEWDDLELDIDVGPSIPGINA